MADGKARQRDPARMDQHLARQQAIARRVALAVAALLVAALLGPFVVGYVTS